MDLDIGSKAINFTLPNKAGKMIRLNQFKGKNIVLYFYPKDDTPGCTLEAINFSKQINEFEKKNTVIIGVSADTKESHNKFCDKYSLKIILLSDIDYAVIKAYNAYDKKNIFGKAFSGTTRKTYLIDKDFKIKYIWEKVKVFKHAKEVLEMI
jgi:peroxiredoxin Q/BCP